MYNPGGTWRLQRLHCSYLLLAVNRSDGLYGIPFIIFPLFTIYRNNFIISEKMYGIEDPWGRT